MKGVDQYRYEFGVFLLNKNIEQVSFPSNIVRVAHFFLII